MSHTSQNNDDWRLKLLRLRMVRTREALSEKLEKLGEHVRGAAKVVEDTVETVQSVTQTFDVQRHPWLMVGSAVAVGYIGGLLLERSAPPPPQPVVPPTSHERNGSPAPSAPHSETGPGWMQQLAGILGTEAGRLKRQAVGTALGLARDFLAPEIPQSIRPFWQDISRKLTVWLGGDPISSPILPSGNGSPPHEEGEIHATKRNHAEMGRSMGPTCRQGETTLGPDHGR